MGIPASWSQIHRARGVRKDSIFGGFCGLHLGCPPPLKWLARGTTCWMVWVGEFPDPAPFRGQQPWDNDVPIFVKKGVFCRRNRLQLKYIVNHCKPSAFHLFLSTLNFKLTLPFPSELFWLSESAKAFPIFCSSSNTSYVFPPGRTCSTLLVARSLPQEQNQSR